ncbi:hypothetical protein ACU8MP_25480 (plasmid) [Rhizobium leguminosarum]
MGWKTPKIDYVNGYKIVEVEGPSFKVYDGDRQLGDDSPYPGEAARICARIVRPVAADRIFSVRLRRDAEL